MPDQIDLSKMQSVPVVGPFGFLRLHRYWQEPDGAMWDEIWDNTSSKKYWKNAIDGQLGAEYSSPFFRYLPKGAKVLEAGCGLGQVVLALRAHGYDCHGLDYAEKTINLLQKEFPEVPFCQGDIRELPYEAGSFDGYISLGVMEHFTEGQDNMLAEAARVVRPGGWIFLSVPALNGWRKLRCRLGMYDKVGTAPFFESCLSVDEMEMLLKKSGFEPVEHAYFNTPMTFVQETFLRSLYLQIEDSRYIRGAVDRVLKLILPKSVFGHMVMIAARRV